MSRRINMGAFNLGPLPEQWRRLDQLAEMVHRVDASWRSSSALTLTARSVDEHQPAGHRAYMVALGQLGSGYEHAEALQSLLEHHGATPRAPWTLMRSIFEAGFWASWVLDPEDGRERRQCGLTVEVRDWKESGNLHEVLGVDDADHSRVRAEHRQTFTAEGAQLGTTWARLTQRLNVVDALERLELMRAFEPAQRRMVVGVWRLLSGLQHGLPYAILNSSDLTNEVEVHGGYLARASINDERFQTIGTASNLLLMSASELYIRRCTQPAR